MAEQDYSENPDKTEGTAARPSEATDTQAVEKQRKRRNVTLALMVGGFIILIYAVTIIRLGSSVAERTF